MNTHTNHIEPELSFEFFLDAYWYCIRNGYSNWKDHVQKVAFKQYIVIDALE